MDEPVALRLGLRQRRQEPRRALEELGARVLRPAGLGAADRVPADEPGRFRCGRADRGLRRADVGHRAAVAARRQHGAHLAGELPHRRRDDRELRAAPAPRRAWNATESTAPRSAATSAVLRSSSNPATLAPSALRGEPDRGSDQPSADDRELHYPICLPIRATSSPDRARELGELAGRDLLRPVGERLLGLRMRLDDDPVRADRGCGRRERQHEVAPPRRVRRVDDHRQVRLLLEHRDGAEIERVARRASRRS